LQELHVGNNAIRTVTADMLTSLVSLSVLDLRDNQLDALPDEVGLCQTLQRLDLTNNSLSTLVAVRFSVLYSLQSLLTLLVGDTKTL